jgi:uncharacterized Zn finger protein (UPF0148 family)
MSDFDKEAERQRLREKYEKDTERREETQRMSELLLQGATMTNSHCNECGTPIFRYQGTEFCPNCQHKQASAAAEQADAAAAEVAEGQAEANGATTPPATADGQADAEGATESGAADAGAAGTAETPTAEAASPQSASQSGSGAPTPASSATRTDEAVSGVETATPATTADATATDATATPATTAPETGASMQTARESLLEAVTRHARRATAADEPRRAKQHLEAAREAAEALDALGR